MTEENLPGMGPLQSAWVRALESGKYEQTSGNLKTDEGFCCLGVACNLVDPNAWVLSKINEDGTPIIDWDEAYSFEIPDYYGTYVGLPPAPVWDEKLKLRTNDGGLQIEFENLSDEVREEHESTIDTLKNMAHDSEVSCCVLDKLAFELVMKETGGAATLVNMNDEGFSFKKIARVIRMFPKMVFYEEA